jgi:hypothetical protein
MGHEPHTEMNDESVVAGEVPAKPPLGFSPIWWLSAKLWAGVCAFGRLMQWFLVPKGDTPLDVLKHYVSVLIVLIGAGALLWSAKQIAYPPLVITVAKLPDPLEKEYWLNPELSRTLVDEIERLRATVKGERDPTFEAVLNPPNITINTEGFSLNVQEQFLTPLGSLLGRGQGEVHLSLNCYHPGCARTTDKECQDLAPLKASDSKVPESTTADGKTARKQYLCLRLTADIQRGHSHLRLTPPLTVSPDDAEMTDAMARVAEAVTTVADPATATLYFYSRIREEKRKGTAADVIADLVSEASKAAEQAETNDAVSACWAHTVRAHLAVDRREFNLATIYLARAQDISLWSHLSQATSPSNCRRLIVIAKMEFARQLARPPENETYPPYPDNQKKGRGRVEAAFEHVQRLLHDQQPGMWAGMWARLFGNSLEDNDLIEALKLVQAEIALSLYVGKDKCGILDAAPGSIDPSSAPRSVKDAIVKLESLTPGEQLPTLTRQAALDFLSSFARNSSRFAENWRCTERVVAVLQKLNLNHPNDPRMAPLLIAITEAAGLRKTASLNRPAEEGDKGNPMIDIARKVHRRLVATGQDQSGSALTRLAVFAEARSAEAGEGKDRAVFAEVRSVEDGDGEDKQYDIDERLQDLRRAWQRHKRDINALREHGELIVAIWGMALLRSYTGSPILTTDFSSAPEEAIASPEYRGALAQKVEFEAALRSLYPKAHPLRLADLPHLTEIGPRIGCLCMLSHVTLENELQDFFIGRVDKWQKEKPDQTACRRDLIPAIQTTVSQRLIAMVRSAERQEQEAAEKLQAAEPKTKELQEDLEKKKSALQKLQEQLNEAKLDAASKLKRFKEKSETVTEAAKVCYVEPPAPPATPPAPPLP